MAHVIAMPGDRIVITNPSLEYDYGKEFIVIESSVSLDEKSDCVWVSSEKNGGSLRFYHTSYRIVSRKSVLDMSREEMKSDSEGCPDCHGTGMITLLRSVVKCQCRTGELSDTGNS